MELQKLLALMRQYRIPQIFINATYLLGKWKFQSNKKEFLNGFLYYYMNGFRFKKLGYPLIKYSQSFIRNHHSITIGGNVTIGFNCFISPVQLEVGNHCTLGVNNFICGKVVMGNDVHLGPNVSIPGASHNIDTNMPLSKSGSTMNGTTIEDFVWVGSNVTILDGVKICTGAVVSANSLVNKDVPPYAVVGGVPAKILYYRPEITVN